METSDVPVEGADDVVHIRVKSGHACIREPHDPLRNFPPLS
jgi:hypothetical protein